MKSHSCLPSAVARAVEAEYDQVSRASRSAGTLSVGSCKCRFACPFDHSRRTALRLRPRGHSISSSTWAILNRMPSIAPQGLHKR